MAQSDRFYFWRGYYDALKMLPTAEQRDALVMGICSYAFDGEEPDFSGDATLAIGWAILRDQVRESVEIGRDASRRGSMGGRPRKAGKTSAKSRAKTSALTSAKSSVKSCAESCAESEEKRSETSLLTERSSGVAVAADAAPLRHDVLPPNIPPRPRDWH
jgi:hypothetical protein